jgi:DNA-binding NtrC family response regulator
MKILILDGGRKRRNQLSDALQKKRFEITALYSSNEFISAIEKGSFDLLLLDLGSWNRSKAIYNRFGIARRIESLPIVFYNAPLNFSILNDRPRHAKDRILFKPTEVDAVVMSFQDNR